MAKKATKKPPIVNGLKEDYIVTKSRPIMLMREVPFALGELKVLDTYLSRINPMDPEGRTVRFSKEEYEKLMGIERMHPSRLSKYVDSLMGKVVHIPDSSARGGWRKYTLFSTSECGQDENEQWWIDLTCTTEAKNLFFNVQGIGFIRYQLKNVLPMTSKYGVLLYVYLLDNRFRGSWTVDLEELRLKTLRCEGEAYEEFKYFKRDVLDKAMKEVNTLTDLTYEYEPVRVGRKVAKIKFTLIKDEVTLPLEEDPNQLRIEDFDDEDELDPNDRNAIYAASLPPELTPEEVEALRFMAVDRVEYDPFGGMPMEVRIADYLQHKTNLLRIYEAKHKVDVKDKCAWLRKAIEQNWT